MTIRPSLPVRIIARSIEAEERGKVYEQTVIAEVEPGKSIAVYDSPPHVDESMINQACSLELLAFFPDLERVTAVQPDIEGWRPNIRPRFHNRAFQGNVVAIVGDDFLLDVGYGTILVSVHRNEQVATGDAVRISDFRLDLLSAPVRISR